VAVRMECELCLPLWLQNQWIWLGKCLFKKDGKTGLDDHKSTTLC